MRRLCYAVAIACPHRGWYRLGDQPAQFRARGAGISRASCRRVVGEDNVAWRVDVKGRGWSSPVAWNTTVFVTSAISPGAFKAPSTGIFGNDYVAELMKQGLSEDEVNKRVISRDIELTSETGEIRYMVYAFDANSGKLKWEREAHKGAPFGGRHSQRHLASERGTDGERLLYFGNVGLFAYLARRQLLWTTRFDPQPMYLDFGTAASPVVHDGQRLRRARQRRQIICRRG